MQATIMTRHDIRRVIRKFPTLTTCGIGADYPYSRADRQAYTPEEIAEKLAKWQEELLRSSALCSAVCVWLQNLTPIKSPSVSSYHLKHLAETAIRTYVPNGVLIAAAVHCRFNVQHNRGPNVGIGVSHKSLKPWRETWLLGEFADEPSTLSLPRKPIALPHVIPSAMAGTCCAASLQR